MRRHLFAILLAGSLCSCMAHPYYWAEPLLNPLNTIANTPSPAACAEHPSLANDTGNHPSVRADSTIGIALLVGGTPSTTVCAGQAYNVTVTFPEARESLVTASYGIFDMYYLLQQPANGGFNCTQRSIGGLTGSYSDILTIPCDASGALVIKVTSGTAETNDLLQTESTISLNTSCNVGVCAPPDASISPPPPSPSPPSSSLTSAILLPILAGANCLQSTLGYSCAKDIGGVRVHWTTGGSAPINACTQANVSSAGSNSTTSGPATLHMAVEGNTTGYVALGFADTPGVMSPMDAIIGSVDGRGRTNVGTYSTDAKDVSQADDASTWTVSSSVAHVAPTTIVCFTRRLQEPGAKVSSSLSLSSTSSLKLNWAMSSSTALSQHNQQGGAYLNTVTGEVTEITSKDEMYIRTHGILMSVAWVLLLPIGAFLPRHRWVFGEAKLWGVHVWFRMHLLLQLLGFALLIAGFVIAVVLLPDAAGDIGSAHSILGYIIMAMALAQVVAGFLRPAPSSTRRPLFNAMHHWLGRVAIVVAWVNIYLGITVFHRTIYAADLVVWIVPVAVVMGTLALAELVLTIMERRQSMWNPPDGTDSTRPPIWTTTVGSKEGSLMQDRNSRYTDMDDETGTPTVTTDQSPADEGASEEREASPAATQTSEHSSDGTSPGGKGAPLLTKVMVQEV